MREIEFRAWDKETQSLRYVLVVDWLNGVVDLDSGLIERQFDEVELMQSTGLVDKAGVQIFEGDIVILCWSDEVGESHWGKVIIKNPFEYTPEEARYFIHSDEIEVIGNIYENPELLEV